MTNRQLAKFLLITIGLGLATQLVASGGAAHRPSGPWLLVTMWCPAIAALLTSATTRKAARVAVKRIAWKWIPLGILVGWGPTLVANAWLLVTSTGHFNHEQFHVLPDGRISIPKLANLVADTPLSPPLFALNLMTTLALASVLYGIVAGLGEELGWRAVLQPALERRLGQTRGVLVVGLIWAYWHLPVNLMGYNDGKHPVANALVFFPLAVVMMAYSFGWLSRSSGSVWPAAVAHSANNAIGAGFLMKESSWGAGLVADLVGALVVGTLFLCLTWRSERTRAAQAKFAGDGDKALEHEAASFSFGSTST